MVWRIFYDWNMDRNSLRNTDEYSGSVEYTGDKTVQSVGIDRLGAADGVSGLRGSMVFTGRDSVGTLWQVENKYTLLGGILGTFITVTVIRSMGKLGPAQATMLIVIAQLVVSYLIEIFGLFGVEKQPFEWKKLAGTAIVVAGIVLFKWE